MLISLVMSGKMPTFAMSFRDKGRGGTLKYSLLHTPTGGVMEKTKSRNLTDLVCPGPLLEGFFLIGDAR